MPRLRPRLGSVVRDAGLDWRVVILTVSDNAEDLAAAMRLRTQCTDRHI